MRITASEKERTIIYVSQHAIEAKEYSRTNAHRLSYAECVLTKSDVAKIMDAADDYLKGYIQNQAIDRHKDYER